MQDATDYASSGPIFLFLSSPLRILFLAPSLISLRFLSGLCSERRPFFFLPLLHISPQLGSVLRSRKEAQRQFLFVVACVRVFFFFFLSSAVCGSLVAAAAAAVFVWLFSTRIDAPHNHWSLHWNTPKQPTREERKKKKKEETRLRRRFLDFLFIARRKHKSCWSFFFFWR